MQRITIPVFLPTPETVQDSKMGNDSPDTAFKIADARIFTDKIIAFYPRFSKDKKPTGTTIEAVDTYFQTPLSPDELEDLLVNLETDAFVNDLKQMGFKGPEDLIPPNFDDTINNMLNPGGN